MFQSITNTSYSRFVSFVCRQPDPGARLRRFAMTTRLSASLYAAALLAVLLLLCPRSGPAQTQYQEDFTSTSTTNKWYFFNGACLTAGTTTSGTAGTAGNGNGCTAIDSSYYSGEPLVGGANGTSGPTQTLPDPDKSGALRLTNGCTKESGNACTNTTQVTGAATKTHTYGGGHNQNGAILSADTISTTAGISITFKTVTYRGDSQGTGSDGADGISFFLMDGSVDMGTYADDFGAFGGSLGYTCSNTNSDPTKRSDGSVRGYDGIVGGYMALGIDEYGNFLNGVNNTLKETDYVTSAGTGDNTASGGYYKPGRIGLRGAGSIAWKYLNSFDSLHYPSNLTLAGQQAAVQNTCKTGTIWDYSTYTANGKSTNTGTAISDYNAITGAYKVVSGLFTIANESAVKRGSTTVANSSSSAAYPITYNLKIAQNQTLSLSYSYNGGAFQPVITGQSFSNGTLPASFRFGFAGSTGGASNIHEILCFKASPGETAASSGGINTFHDPTIKIGTQFYTANYFPSDWSGQLLAQTISYDTTKNTLVLSTPAWDARCVLTGVNATTGTCSTGQKTLTAEDPTARVMLTWNGTSGVAFEWGSVGSTMQNTLDAGDTTQTSSRLTYLRGDRSQELSSAGTCPQLTTSSLPCFRARNSVLGDIVDSSPTWVGPPQTYISSVNFKDSLWSTDTSTETAYSDFSSKNSARQNVVYVGANDGFLHGFRAGSLDTNGNLVDNKTTPNDGYEVLAYMPGAVYQTIHNSSQTELDYANTQYAHNWYVDATPGTGDLYYSGAWHTWLVGGIGAGGQAFYALDITDPTQFSESNASTLVIGEWNTSLTCQNDGKVACGKNLGNTYGTPLIRRFHNGQWGVIFGNGYGASNVSAAGIYIMLIDAKGNKTWYYYATPALKGTSTANGIGSPTAGDIDSDHIVDYIYAGDLQGHVWRFDVTQPNPASWTVSATSPLFTTPNNQPITTAVTVGTLKGIDTTSLGGQVLSSNNPERVIIGIGTGQQIPQTLTSAAQYASGTQYLFGVWDWDMVAVNTPGQTPWNTLSTLQAVGINAASESITTSNLQQQTITTNYASNGTAYRVVSTNAVCWVVYMSLDGSSSCGTGAGTMLGWYMALPSTGEQAIFNPVISTDGAFVINTFIAPQDSPLSCTTASQSSGFTMAVDPETGGGTTASDGSGGFFSVNTNSGVAGADGLQLNGTGIPSFISSGQKGDNNSEYLLTQTSNGAAAPTPTNRHAIVVGKRLNWVQRR